MENIKKETQKEKFNRRIRAVRKAVRKGIKKEISGIVRKYMEMDIYIRRIKVIGGRVLAKLELL